MSNEGVDMAWRGSLDPNARHRLITNLAQELKSLSPGTHEAQLFDMARTFETSIYSKCNSSNEYYSAHLRKSAQIRKQKQLSTEAQVSPNAVDIGGLVVDSGGGVFQQQVQAITQQPALQSSQVQQTLQLANQVRPQILVAGQQQHSPMLSQQQITRQIINARNIQAQQRQAMVAAVAGGQHQPQPPMPQQVFQQQVQTAIQNLKPSIGNLTPQQVNLLLQHQRLLLQQQAVQSGSTATAPQQIPTGVLQQQPRLSTTAPQIGARPKMTLDTAVGSTTTALPVSHPLLVGSLNTTGSSVHQKLAMTTQQQQQDPSNPVQVSISGMGRPPQVGVSHSQHGAAVQIVHGMDKTILANRVKTSELSGLSEEEKKGIREQITLMSPMFQRVDQLLPVFLALTSNQEATKRLMLMKYMFQDQLEALPHNKYVISLANLKKLKEQFSRYFMWVKNQIGGQNPIQTTGVSSPDTNAQMTAQRIQELRQQAMNAGPLKHAQLDLRLPPAKRQATGSQQSSPTTGAVLMQQNSQGIAARDTGAGPTPLQAAQSTTPVRPLIPGVPPHQQQQAIQTAIASGLAPQVAANLSREALQAQYVLQQANAGKATLTPQQKAQLHSLYAHQVTFAKNLVAQQANAKALAATPLHQYSAAAAAIDQKSMEIQQPAILTTAVDAVEYKKQAMAQKQMQTFIRQQQPQPIPAPIIKIEPMEVPTPSAAVAAGTAVAPSQPDIKIKEEPEVVAPLVTVKAEPVAAPRTFFSPRAICEKTITDPRPHAEDVIRKFVEMHVDESRQNSTLSTLPVFPSSHILAPVVEVRSGAGYFDDEDCMQENGGAIKRPVSVRMKDILRGFKLPEEDSDRQEEMIDSEVEDERAFGGKGNLGKEGEAVRREISKLGHDWVLSPS